NWLISNSWPNTTDMATPFRNVVRGDASYDQQSLRLGIWSGQAKVVLSTVGGSVLVTTPGSAPWVIDFPTRDANKKYFVDEIDHGYGAMALAVARVGVRTDPIIFYATIHTHADDEPTTRDMVSSLHLLDYVSANELSVRFDGRNGLPKLYGIAGLAVGDLLEDGTPIPEEL